MGHPSLRLSDGRGALCPVESQRPGKPEGSGSVARRSDTRVHQFEGLLCLGTWATSPTVPRPCPIAVTVGEWPSRRAARRPDDTDPFRKRDGARWDLARERADAATAEGHPTGSIAQYQLSADNRTLLLATRMGPFPETRAGVSIRDTLFDLGGVWGNRRSRWMAAGLPLVPPTDSSKSGTSRERRRVQQFGHYSGSVRAVQFSEDGSRLIVFDRRTSAGWSGIGPRRGKSGRFPCCSAAKSPSNVRGLYHPTGDRCWRKPEVVP